MECHKLTLMEGKNMDGSSKTVLQNYFLISSCPVDNADSGMCSNVNADATRSIPVCLPEFDLLFRNIYCLICHGFSPEEAVAFRFDVPNCVDRFDELNSTPFSENKSVDVVWDACGIFGLYNIPKQCEATASRMLCLHGDRTAEQKCSAYSNPVAINNVGLVYKNQFCVPVEYANISCLEYNVYPHGIPIFISGNFLLSVTILLDFSHGYPTSMVKINKETENDSHPVISSGSIPLPILVQAFLGLFFLATDLEIIFEKTISLII